MKVLVAIANHGTSQLRYLERLLAAYRGMPLSVDIVVLSDAPKDLGPDVEVLVGSPLPDPRSLPYAHRSLFADRLGRYDVYIYSEDDTLVEERHIKAFLDATAVLPPHQIAGFLRREHHPDGALSCSSMHSHYHWVPSSVERIGGRLFAQYTNDHGAVYMLTDEQLRRAIDSGGFLIEPHLGRYSMMVSAATDPYTTCGLQKMICVSDLDDFLLHHLPDKYLGTLGAESDELAIHVEALEAIADGRADRDVLFTTETALDDFRWDKLYYEPPLPVLVDVVGATPQRVLSVGSGYGALEADLVAAGHTVTAIPLDAVAGAVTAHHGVEVLRPSLDGAAAQLGDRRFDTVVAMNVLNHVEDPVEWLRRLTAWVRPGGRIIATVPNFRHEAFRARLGKQRPAPARTTSYADARVHITDAHQAKAWFRQVGLRPRATYQARDRSARHPALLPVSGRWLAETVIVSATVADTRSS